jgi:hypothetical protein
MEQKVAKVAEGKAERRSRRSLFVIGYPLFVLGGWILRILSLFAAKLP